MHKIIAASLAALMVGAAPARAQEQASFAQVQLSGLPTVYVTDRAGREVRGKLLQITDSALTIQLPEGAKTYTPDDVSLVERRGDPLSNGAFIGMGVGVGLGVLAMGLADCPSGNHSCPGTRIAGVLWSTAFYTAVGAGIDAAVVGRSRIWPARHQQSGGPVASASAADRRLFIGWRVTR